MAAEVVSGRDSALAHWLRAIAATSVDLPETLQERQRQAAARLQQMHLPTRKDEAWRFTDLAELTAIAWQGVPVAEVASNSDASAWAIPEAAGQQLVFINGRYAPYLSDTSALPPEVTVGNLVAAEASALPLERLGEYASGGDVFATLNAAGYQDAAFIWIPTGVALERPLHLLFVSAAADAPVLVQPRALIVLEASASLTLVEQFVSCEAQAATFTNAATEISLAPNARLVHARLQAEATEKGFHIGQTRVHQGRDSAYTNTAVATGAKFSRHNLAVSLDGDRTETHLQGLTVARGTCLADTHSEIAHHYPHGTSNQLHKCLLDGSARGVFDGKILVPQAAQQTNAAQLNRNLLLSPKARIDTKPQLQITADNVKCSHGATVSQLEADEVFYLRSRGLSEAAARHLLVDAFAAEILKEIPAASLRDRLTATLLT